MIDQLSDVIETLTQPLKRRVFLMVRRAYLNAVNDAKDCQQIELQADTGETLQDVEHPQHYGFTSHPIPETAEILLLSIGGNRTDPQAVVVEDRTHRLKNLAQGEVALHDDQGQKIVLHRNRIHVTSPNGKSIKLECGRSSIVIADGGVTITTPAFDVVKA